MKKFLNQKDLLANLIFILSFLIIYLFLTKDNHLFASTTDFAQQHYLIPEYLRTLFYETHDLFPDFAPNIGSGQNIYYLSYYGLFNPYILLSYLFPKIEMINYLIITNCLIVLTSTSLFYFYLRKNHYNEKTSFITAFLFLMSSPLIFHAKRHIMFINYFPFLILGLYGIDTFFKRKKTTLLTLSITLIILSSYYFSIPSLIVLFLYSLYQYTLKTKIITRKKFITFLKKISLPFITGIFTTTILTIPTLYVLLNGRTPSTQTPTVLELLTPSLTSSLLYSSYSIGHTLISLITIIYFIFHGDKETKYFSIFCFLIIFFPIFNYILNGTLYINSKSLIPFSPIILLLVAKFLSPHLKNKFNKKQCLILMYLFITSFTLCLYINKNDKLMKEEDINNQTLNNTKYLIQEITSQDKTFYRINTETLQKSGMNLITTPKEYKTTIYSSTSNQNYISTYNNILDNPIPNRNKFVLSSNSNPISQILLNEKYTLTKNDLGTNLELIKEQNGIKLYKNNNTLPLGYATNQIINSHQFSKLTYPTNNLVLLNNIILNNIQIPEKTIHSLPSQELKFQLLKMNNVEISNNKNITIIKAKKNAYITIQLNENINNKILFLRFHHAYTPTQDLSITINQIKNKLTDKSWKYKNKNTIFNYVLHGTDTLNILFKEGTYQLNNFESYILDYSKISNLKKNIDEFQVNTTKTKGDYITGTINVTKENSYFTISIPYDKGFKITIDNKPIQYQKSGINFITFPISKGKHTIEITYQAPYKKISIITSIIGLTIWIITLYKEKNMPFK